MASDRARTLDPEYPNLPAEVVDAYRNAPESVVAEIIDGELSTMPRPAPMHASAASIVDQSLSPAFRWGRGAPAVGSSCRSLNSASARAPTSSCPTSRTGTASASRRWPSPRRSTWCPTGSAR